jgi:hypothetical protein
VRYQELLDTLVNIYGVTGEVGGKVPQTRPVDIA